MPIPVNKRNRSHCNLITPGCDDSSSFVTSHHAFFGTVDQPVTGSDCPIACSTLLLRTIRSIERRRRSSQVRAERRTAPTKGFLLATVFLVQPKRGRGFFIQLSGHRDIFRLLKIAQCLLRARPKNAIRLARLIAKVV